MFNYSYIDKLKISTAIVVGSISLAVNAAEVLTADQINQAVSDHTYQGSMTDASFAEFYDANGDIKGKGYTGSWRTEENTMCFKYGDNPEKCWQVELNGPAMTLYKDGKVDGSGMLVEGNPNEF